jgi:hypothetical protein
MPAHPLPIGGHQIGHQKDTDEHASRHIDAQRHHVQTATTAMPHDIVKSKRKFRFSDLHLNQGSTTIPLHFPGSHIDITVLQIVELRVQYVMLFYM